MSEKLYNFYGMSTPTLLLAPVEVVQEMLSKLTNSFSSHMLNSLCVEAKLLRYSLYERGVFRYYIDEETEYAQSIIRYADFGLAYRKYLSEMSNQSEDGDSSKKEQDASNGASDSGSVSTNYFGSEGSGKKVSLEFDDMPDSSLDDIISDMGDLGDLDELDELDAMSSVDVSESSNKSTDSSPKLEFDDIPDLPGIPAGINDDFTYSDDLGDSGEPGKSDGASLSNLPAMDFDSMDDLGGLDDLGDLSELDELDVLDDSENGTDILSSLGIVLDGGSDNASKKSTGITNKGLLEELAYDAKFYNTFNAGNFEEVSKRIKDWKCERIFTVADLRRHINSAHHIDPSKLPGLEESLKELNRKYEELREQAKLPNAFPDMLEVRFKTNAKSRDEITTKINDIELYTKWFDADFADSIAILLESCPRALAREYNFTGRSEDEGELTDLEYAILSTYHKCCIEDIKGVRKIDYLIDLLDTTRDRNTVNTQKFFNVAFNVLATKNSPSSLLVFNKQFKEFLKTYKDITDKLYVKSIQDCRTLLSDAKEREATLKEMFTIQQSRYGDSAKDIFPVTIMDVEIRVTALENEGKLQKFGFNGVTVEPTEVTEFIRILIRHECLLDIIDSDESVYALFKIWVMIRKYSAVQMLNYAGVANLIEPDENGIISVSADWLKQFFMKFGIPGLYADPEGKFLRCLRSGVNLVDEDSTSIDPQSKKNLYENIVIIQRYLESVMVSVNNELPILSFWG